MLDSPEFLHGEFYKVSMELSPKIHGIRECSLHADSFIAKHSISTRWNINKNALPDENQKKSQMSTMMATMICGEDEI